MDEVAAVTASGVKHAHAGLDVPAQDLIEYVDVDLAELFLNVQGDSAFELVPIYSSFKRGQDLRSQLADAACAEGENQVTFAD